MSDEIRPPVKQRASVRAGAMRLRFIGADGSVVVIEPFEEVELDVSKAPWTYVPETELQ